MQALIFLCSWEGEDVRVKGKMETIISFFYEPFDLNVFEGVCFRGSVSCFPRKSVMAFCLILPDLLEFGP